MSNARGSLYKQPKSPYWWASYYVNGKQVRESTKQVNKKEAQKFLAGKVSESKVPDKRTISALLDGLVADYEHNHRKGISWCKMVVKTHLRPYFGKMKADALTKQTVTDYIAKRRGLKKENSTINREIALLRRSFSIAEAAFPRIRKLAENNVRKGFITPEQYVKLLAHMPEHIKPILAFGYKTGCRRGEILNLKWRSVDLPHATVRLEPGETKNGQGRSIPLSSDLVTMFEALPRTSDHVFTYRGKPVGNFRQGWNKGCVAAGLPDVLFHDLRRSGIRNLVRAGASEHVVMSISGHKTRAVFDRYNIVSETDQQDAMKKLEASQTMLERQAENMLPAKMDKFMEDAKPEEKGAPKKVSKRSKATSATAESTEKAS